MICPRQRVFDNLQKALWGSTFVALSYLVLTACQPKPVTTARIHIQNDEWKQALAELERAAEKYPDNPEVHYLLGLAYGHESHFKEMTGHFERSLQISNRFAPEIGTERERHWIEKYNAAILDIDQKDFKTSETNLESAILIDPNRVEAHKKLAQVYLNTDRTDQALTKYHQLIDQRPDDLELLIATSRIYYDRKDFGEVITILRKVLQVEPKNRDALARLAISLDSLGETDQAAQAFESAVQAHPLLPDRHLRRCRSGRKAWPPILCSGAVLNH